MGVKDFFINFNNLFKQPTSQQVSNLKGYKVVDYDLANEPLLRGKAYSFNPNTLILFSKTDPFISACRNKKVNKTMSGGYFIDTDVEDGQAEVERFEEWNVNAGGSVEEFGRSINFSQVLRRLVDSLVVGDELYMFVRGNEAKTKIVDGGSMEVHVLDWESMSPNREEGGVLKNYVQKVDNKVVATFEPEDIINTNFYGEGMKAFGRPLISTVLHSAARKIFAERFASAIFVKQRPKYKWVITGSEDFYEETKMMIKKSGEQPEADIFIRKELGEETSKVDVEELTKPSDFPYEKFIENSRVEICVGMGVPPASIFLPGVSTGWDGDIQLHEFDEDINCLRDFIERIVNEQLFPRLGFENITFHFSRTNTREELRKAQISRLMSDVLTINERRVKYVNVEEKEEGDIIAPSFSSPQQNSPSSGADPNASGREHEVSTILGGVVIKDLSPKNIFYYRKSFGNGSFTKKPEGKKATRKEIRASGMPKIEKMAEQFAKELETNLFLMIDEIREAMLKSEQIEKISNPKKQVDDIEFIKRKNIVKADIASNKHIFEAYNYGVNLASVETGVTNKILEDPEALEFLRTMSIDLVEGAMSEVAQRAKTALRLGISNHESVLQISKRIENVKGGIAKTYKSRMLNIARTEVSRAVNEGRLYGYEKSNVVAKVQALIGEDPEGLCSETLEGSPYSYGVVMTLEEAHGLIPVHCRCGCTWVPVLE